VRDGVELQVCDSCWLSDDVRLDGPCDGCGEEGGNHSADCYTWDDDEEYNVLPHQGDPAPLPGTSLGEES
jgi:hypothetical protein